MHARNVGFRSAVGQIEYMAFKLGKYLSVNRPRPTRALTTFKYASQYALVVSVATSKVELHSVSVCC